MLGSTLTLATVAALFSNPNVVDDDCWHRCAKERALHCKSFPGSNACVFNHCGFWWDPVRVCCFPRPRCNFAEREKSMFWLVYRR